MKHQQRRNDMGKTLDLGKLHVHIGKEFKLVGDVLTVPAGSTIDQIAEFLESLKK